MTREDLLSLLGSAADRPPSQTEYLLVRAHLRRIFWRKLPPRVYMCDDFVHETLLRAIAGRETLKNALSVESWFYKIASRVLADTFKRKARDLRKLQKAQLATPDATTTENHNRNDPDGRGTGSDDTADTRAHHSRRELALLRDWIQVKTGDEQLVKFMDSLLASLQHQRLKSRVKYVIEQMSLNGRGQYNALFAKLKRASRDYPRVHTSVLSE